MRKKFERILYSFPIQLLLVHVRRNTLLVLIWVLFIAIITGNFGRVYGVHFLFLDPEYLNTVGFWSFFLVGVAFGNLVSAFNITCYILDGHRFSFIGILERPFAKFSVNNSLLPFIGLVVYVIFIVRFQFQNEFSSYPSLLINLIGLFLGLAVVLLLFFSYFKWTNKDIFRFLSGSVDKTLRKSKINRSRVLSRLKEGKQKYEVRSYFDLRLKERSCIKLQDFYDKEALLKVFDQNHFNSVVIQMAFIIIIIGLGFFMGNPYFQIPAAASVLLMFAIFMMLIGAVSYWFKGWSIVFVLTIFLVINFMVRLGVLKGVYEAKGLDYEMSPMSYGLSKLQELNSSERRVADSTAMQGVMNAWKEKQTDSLHIPIFVCVSGGGQRAALWTVNGLIEADSALNNTLMERSMLMTGASGGMIGAAYYRENYLHANNASADKMLDNMGKDNLNAIIFSLLVNDAFFRVRTFHYADKKYVMDRGYVFEENLNKNLDGVFDKKLSDYTALEQNASIPMLLMSPVIANDGRTLFISSLPMSYMNMATGVKNNREYKIKGIGLSQLLPDHGASDLSFLTALRMSASFPYITPTISLPTTPKIEVMDAGIADNFGVSDATRFLAYFQRWFEQNTDGVVLLIIRDSRKNSPIEAPASPSITDRLTNPIANVYNNLGSIQDINNDDQLEALEKSFGVPVHIIQLEYNTYSNIDQEYLLETKELERKQLERASLSWHLTTREKKNIIDNMKLPNNQASLEKLKQIYIQ